MSRRRYSLASIFFFSDPSDLSRSKLQSWASLMTTDRPVTDESLPFQGGLEPTGAGTTGVAVVDSGRG
jgi:hypothetical protein